MKYRNKTSGLVSTQGEIRRANSNSSFPRVWDSAVCESLDIDPVLEAPKPEVTNLQQVVADGVELDALGNWVNKWLIIDKFTTYTDDADVTHTQLEQETAYLQSLEDIATEALRAERNKLLAATDFYALTDVTMSPEMTTYRQALRDLPANTVDVFNPVYPELLIVS
jgi:hypothetical protein